MHKKLKFPLQISLVHLNKSVDSCDRVFLNKVAGQKFATLLKKRSVSGDADLCTKYLQRKTLSFCVRYGFMRASEFCVVIPENIYIPRLVTS